MKHKEEKTLPQEMQQSIPRQEYNQIVRHMRISRITTLGFLLATVYLATLILTSDHSTVHKTVASILCLIMGIPQVLTLIGMQRETKSFVKNYKEYQERQNHQ